MKRAAIIGGGIGGLATAIALRKVGFDVHVYERASELKEAGSGLSLWPNALRSLEKIDSNVFRRVKGNGYPLRRFLMKEPSGKSIKTVQLPKTDLDGIAILRSELLSALAESVPHSSIHLNHSFSHLISLPSSVLLHFHNSFATEADLVIGCDGIYSSVRKSLALDGSLIPRGYSVWRGMTWLPNKMRGAQLGLEKEGDFSESYGRGRRFGIHRLGTSRVHWYAVANESLLPSGLSDSATLSQLFAGWHNPVLHSLRLRTASSVPEFATVPLLSHGLAAALRFSATRLIQSPRILARVLVWLSRMRSFWPPAYKRAPRSALLYVATRNVDTIDVSRSFSHLVRLVVSPNFRTALSYTCGIF